MIKEVIFKKQNRYPNTIVYNKWPAVILAPNRNPNEIGLNMWEKISNGINNQNKNNGVWEGK